MTDEPSAGPASSRPPTDLRGHRQRTERDLILGGFAILFVVGGGLVWYLYGLEAALASWVCMGGAVALFGGLWLILKFMEIWITRRGG